AYNFVLQDHLFEPNYGWSLPAHLFMVSGWSARCTHPYRARSCTPNLRNPDFSDKLAPKAPSYGWTDLTYMLHRHHVSWAYYVQGGAQPDCDNAEAMVCGGKKQGAGTPEIWNPLPDFVTVHRDHQLGNIRAASRFFSAASRGNLPAVSWIVPNAAHSDHPPSSVAAGQRWVTSLVDAVMRSPEWKSSAIFLSWDDWGGFYDHVV
ncbi:MAG: phospholipase, partial [Actinobacteria bacterium]